MAHLTGVAKTTIRVPTGHFKHNPPLLAGTSRGYYYFSWYQALVCCKQVENTR